MKTKVDFWEMMKLVNEKISSMSTDGSDTDGDGYRKPESDVGDESDTDSGKPSTAFTTWTTDT